jgi:hypothetical protein
MVMVFSPKSSGISSDAAPDATAVSLTVAVASGLFITGVTVMLATSLATVAVYPAVPASKSGDKLPLLSDRPARVASLDCCRVTTIVYVLTSPVLGGYVYGNGIFAKVKRNII